MNAVTNLVLAATSNATPTRQAVPAQTSGGTDQAASAQPFTDVLSEQRKTLPEASDKGKSTNDLTPSGQGPASSSKEIVLADASAAVPLVVPVVAPLVVPLVMTNATPVAPGLTVHSAIAVPSGLTQTMVAVAIDDGKVDVKSSVSPLGAETSRLAEGGHSGLVQTMSFSPAASTQGVAGGTPAAEMVVVGEKTAHVGVPDRPAPLNSTMRSMNSTPDQGGIPVRSGLDHAEVAKVASEVHVTQPMPTHDVAAMQHLRDGSVRVTSGLAEPISEPVSSPLAASKYLGTPVLETAVLETAALETLSPTSPTAALASSAGVLGAASRLAQSTPHFLDVSELAGAISRPLTAGTGGYTVLIAMRPAELGQLQAVVTVHGNDLQVSITPQTPVGHEALANAVDTLKEKLSHGGVNVNVTLHDPGSQSRGDGRPATTAVRGEASLSEEPATMSPPSAVLTASQIHLVL